MQPKANDIVIVEPNHRAIHIAFMAALTVILCIFVSLCWSGYQSAGQQAFAISGNLTRTVSDNIEAVLSRVESDLRVFVPQITPQDLAGHVDDARRTDIEMRMGYHLRSFQSSGNYRLFDRAGLLIFAAGGMNAHANIDVSDEKWFQTLRDTPGQDLIISDLIISHSTQRPTIIEAVPIRDAEGNFQGVLAAAFNLEYFQHLIDNLSIGDGGLVVIRNLADYTLLLRRPALSDPIGEANQGIALARQIYGQGPSASGDFVSPLDGVKRRYAYRIIPKYDLAVLVAVGNDDYLAPWRHQTLWTGVLMGLLIIGLTTLYLSQVKSQSDLKQFTLKLSQSEARFRSLVEGSTDWGWETDAQHRLTWVSDSICDLLSRPTSYFVGRLREEIASTQHEIDTTQWQRHLSDLSGHHNFRDFRYWLDDGHGTPHWVSISGAPIFDEDGAFIGYRGSGTDVTHKFEISAQVRLLSSVVESSPIAVIVTDPHSVIQYANAQTSRQSGYTSQELIGQAIDILRSDEAELETTSAVRRALVTTSPWSGDLPSRKKNGKRIWEHVQLTFIRDDFDQIRHHVWLKEDISARKRAEMEILSANRRLDAQAAMLKSVNAELEQFAYAASHDLRQPLRMITSYLDLIQTSLGDTLSPDTQTYFHFVTDGAKRMDRLILDLLEYSRTGRDMTVQPVSVSVAVEHALLNLSVAIRDSGAQITVADKFPDVMGGLTEVTRLFQNLVGNAIKYQSPDRPPCLDIGWSDDAPYWRFWVKDNGIGIDTKNFERVFMVFQRCVAKDAYEGSGIGLAICKKIVDRLHGRIWLESTLDQGTTFFFCLPRAETAHD